MNLIKNLIDTFTPPKFQLPIRYFYNKLFNKLDVEMKFITKLLPKNPSNFIDIGSNVGIYSYYFSKIFNEVYAFEPLEDISFRIKYIGSNVKLYSCALSNKIDKASLYIPIENNIPKYPLASLERKDNSIIKTISINMLDNFNFCNIDLIKIDVEGHELNVINGGINLIKNNSPLILIEIEQRHISYPINQMFQVLLDLNYKGFFISKGLIHDIDFFDYEVHQKPFLEDIYNKNYINNFIFISNRNIDQLNLLEKYKKNYA
jgi:FkbM family methyltransferase